MRMSSSAARSRIRRWPITGCRCSSRRRSATGSSAGGESGNEARPCDYAWVLGLREQCMAADISFCFHQTGARFVKDGRMYRIHRRYQHSQARKAGINYKIGR